MQPGTAVSSCVLVVWSLYAVFGVLIQTSSCVNQLEITSFAILTWAFSLHFYSTSVFWPFVITCPVYSLHITTALKSFCSRHHFERIIILVTELLLLQLLVTEVVCSIVSVIEAIKGFYSWTFQLHTKPIRLFKKCGFVTWAVVFSLCGYRPGALVSSHTLKACWLGHLATQNCL